MSILILVFYTLLISEMQTLIDLQQGNFEEIQYRNRAGALLQLATLVEHYNNEYGAYPADIATLTSTKNYYHARHLLVSLPRLVYSKATISDTLIYERVLISDQDISDVVDASVFTTGAANACGNTSFFDKEDFCPKKNSLYYIADNRNKILSAKTNEARSLDETLHVLLKYHGSSFSDNGGTLSDGDAVTLTDAVGYLGASQNCSGSFDFDGATLGCNDLFNSDGLPITYNYISSTHIALLSQLSFKNSALQPIYVARDIKL